MSIKTGREVTRPQWTPDPTVESKRRWMHEWWTLQSPEFQEANKNKYSSCCRSLMGGRWTGTVADDNVRYEVSCTNCNRVITSRRRPEPKEDRSEAIIGEKEELKEGGWMGQRKDPIKGGEPEVPF